MTDLSILFHALPEELAPLVRFCVAEQRLHVTALRFPPFAAQPLRPDDAEGALLDPSVRTLAFTLGPAALPAESSGRFHDLNPGVLTLDLGRRDENGLRASWLAARSDDPRRLSTSRAVARKLKTMTRAGAVAVQPRTGARAPSRSWRHTAGARALAAQGVPMRATAGTVTYELPA